MVITFAGSNSFLIKTNVDKIISSFVAKHTDLGLERIDGEEADYDRIREALESLPFLATKKLVVLRSPSSNKQFAERAEDLLTNLPDTTDVIIYEPKLDKRTIYAKYLQKKTDFREFAELDAQTLARWINDEVKNRQSFITVANANYLIRRIGPNQQLLASELTKLLNMNKTIDRKLIDDLTEPTPQSSTFDLLEAAFSGEYKRVVELYEEQRRQNVEPQKIIGLLAWQFHILAVCSWAGNSSSSEIAKAAHINPYVVQRSLTLAKKLSSAKIKHHIGKLLQLDESTKTSAINADDALQAYLLTIS